MRRWWRWTVAATVALVLVAWEIERRTQDSVLAQWHGRAWTTACTDLHGQTWVLEGYAYWDRERAGYGLEDRGLRITNREGATYDTREFEAGALAEEGVWRYATPRHAVGFARPTHEILPGGAQAVEVAADRGAVEWIGSAGRQGWECTRDDDEEQPEQATG